MLKVTVSDLYRSGEKLFAATADTLFRSGDGGRTWERCNRGIHTVRSITHLAGNDRFLFAASSNWVFRSGDGGDSWSRVDSGQGSVVNGMAALGSHVFRVDMNDLFHSSDDGATWDLIEKQCENLVWFTGMEAIEGRLYALGNHGDYCVSADTGMTWTYSTGYASSRDVYAMARFGGAQFMGTEIGAYRKADNKTVWEETMDNVGGYFEETILDFADNGAYLFAATEGGVVRFDGLGKDWIQCHRGLAATGNAALAVRPNGLFVASAHFSFRSVDKGERWERMAFSSAPTNGTVGTSLGFLGQAGFFGSQHSGVVQFMDSDYSYFSRGSLTGHAVRALASLEGALHAATDSGLFRTQDSGKTWIAASGMLGRTPFRCVAAGASRLYAGPDSGGAYQSTDGGASWPPMGTGWSAGAALAFAEFGADVYAGTETGLYRLAGGSGAWTKVDGGLQGTRITALAVLRDHLAVVTDDGLQVSREGSAWRRFDEGMADRKVLSLAADATHLYAGTAEDGVWKRPVAEITVGLRETKSRRAGDGGFAGLQHHPARGLEYHLTRPGHARIVLRAPDGRLVRILDEGVRAAGTHRTGLGSGLAPGIYLAELTWEGKALAQQIVLAR